VEGGKRWGEVEGGTEGCSQARKMYEKLHEIQTSFEKYQIIDLVGALKVNLNTHAIITNRLINFGTF